MKINLNNYLCSDIENNVNSKYSQYGRDAGNFKFDTISAIGYAQKGKAKSDYFSPPKTDKEIQLDSRLSTTSVLVGHHFAHDLLFLWENEQLQNFLKSDGRIWCTQYAHYCLTGQEETYPALRDIAVRCYGLPEREKVMEKYWDKSTIKVLNNKGFIEKTYPPTSKMQFPQEDYLSGRVIKGPMQTNQIPEELVRHDVENDVLDTEQIYLQQIKLAEDMNMLPLLLAQMDAIVATTEMTYNGVYVNRQALRKNKQELEIKSTEIEKDLNQIVKKYWI